VIMPAKQRARVDAGGGGERRWSGKELGCEDH
jgi:hypothetical protein